MVETQRSGDYQIYRVSRTLTPEVLKCTIDVLLSVKRDMVNELMMKLLDDRDSSSITMTIHSRHRFVSKWSARHKDDREAAIFIDGFPTLGYWERHAHRMNLEISMGLFVHPQK